MTKDELRHVDELCTQLGIETWMKEPDIEKVKGLLGKLSIIYTDRFAHKE